MCFHEFFIFCQQNEWVHANCALWSSEVYEEVDGSLQNVSQALSRGSKLTCTVCNKRGATIGEFFSSNCADKIDCRSFIFSKC